MGSELPEGGWLGGREGSSIHEIGYTLPSSQVPCASAMVKLPKSDALGGGVVLGVVKLNHLTTNLA
jgi:hypothetical protein